MAERKNAIGLENQHCAFTSKDLDAVKRFYSDQLGFTELEVLAPFNSLVIRTGPSSSLGFTVASERGVSAATHEATVYFVVADVDDTYGTLTGRGVQFEGPPEEKPWGYRVLVTRDPDGRRIVFASQNAPAPDPTPDIAFPSS